jgi:hypothetical protein
MARFVKPILNMTPPDPMSLDATPQAPVSRQPLPRAARWRSLQQVS